MKTQNKLLGSLLSNWVPKILSFVIAVMVVLAVRFLNIGDRSVTLPLAVDLPSYPLYAESLVPDTVEVIISGDDDIIYLVDPSTIRAHADFSDVTEAGIVRRAIQLEYNQDVYKNDKLTVSAKPSSIRILFGASGR